MIDQVLRKLSNFAQNMRSIGLWETFKLYRYRLSENYRERRLGIRTVGRIESEILEDQPDSDASEPIHYRCLDIAFDYLKPNQNESVFLDYGCGKGRAVVVAATHPFRRIIGVELSPRLSDAARENIRSAESKLKCRDVEIVTTDAVDYEIPPDVNVIFLFNPFTGSIMSAVQQRIRQSLEASPRPLQVVYMHPLHRKNSFDDCDWLTKQCDLPSACWDQVKFAVYRSVGAGKRGDENSAVLVSNH